MKADSTLFQQFKVASAPVLGFLDFRLLIYNIVQSIFYPSHQLLFHVLFHITIVEKMISDNRGPTVINPWKKKKKNVELGIRTGDLVIPNPWHCRPCDRAWSV